MERNTVSCDNSAELAGLTRDCGRVFAGLIRHQRELDCSGAVADAVRLLAPAIADLGRLYEAGCNAAPELPSAVREYMSRALAPIRAGYALPLVIEPLQEALRAMATWQLAGDLFSVTPHPGELAAWHRQVVARLRSCTPAEVDSETVEDPTAAPLLVIEPLPGRAPRARAVQLRWAPTGETAPAMPAQADFIRDLGKRGRGRINKQHLARMLDALPPLRDRIPNPPRTTADKFVEPETGFLIGRVADTTS